MIPDVWQDTPLSVESDPFTSDNQNHVRLRRIMATHNVRRTSHLDIRRKRFLVTINVRFRG